MISEAQIEKAVDFLRDKAVDTAQARANRIHAEEYRKHLKALLMAENPDQALGAQERDAYADPRYAEHLLALKKAVHDDEFMRAKREAAVMLIEAWRTQEANRRGVDRVG